MIDTNGTTHAIATTAEAATIGGVTGGNDACILYSQLSDYNCTLKSPVPSGITYSAYQAVQWYDIKKIESPEPGPEPEPTSYTCNIVNDTSLKIKVGINSGELEILSSGNSVPVTYKVNDLLKIGVWIREAVVESYDYNNDTYYLKTSDGSDILNIDRTIGNTYCTFRGEVTEDVYVHRYDEE